MIPLMDIIMMNALISTEGKAKMKICTACFLKTYQSELKELSKISGGRKIKRIPRGSIPDVAYIESPIMPKLSENLPMRILTMKRVGVNGMNFHIFCKLLMTMATVSEKNKNSRTKASWVMNPFIINSI